MIMSNNDRFDEEKTTTVHMHHTFCYISLPKVPCFVEDINESPQICLFVIYLKLGSLINYQQENLPGKQVSK